MATTVQQQIITLIELKKVLKSKLDKLETMTFEPYSLDTLWNKHNPTGTIQELNDKLIKNNLIMSNGRITGLGKTYGFNWTNKDKIITRWYPELFTTLLDSLNINHS